MANQYAAAADLKATLSLSGETFADADIELALSAASRGIDSICGRRFWADADDVVRHYTPDDARELRIDDLVTLTSLKTSPAGDGQFTDVWTVNTDFVLGPLNADLDGRPWTRIEVHPSGRFRLPCHPRSVEVTGRFGWPAVPDTVKQATIVLASKLMRRAREAPFGVITLGLDGGAAHIARTDPDVMFLIGDLIRDRVAVA
ncbi:MAG: hypothetical protein IRZ28_11185 [Steroidobacteraceae bacterium]|nr:hypothetical protein [Steroidobacteraceae bacterium]